MNETHRETSRRVNDDVVGDLVVAIVQEIADREGTPSTAIDPPLATVIDTDALASLVAGADTPVRVTFEYLGYEVTVLAEGGLPEVFVRDRDPSAWDEGPRDR